MKRTTQCLTALLLSLTALTARAESYLGEFCWRTDIETVSTQVTIQLGVYGMEGERYAFYGSVLESGMLINGHAQETATALKGTFTISGNDPTTGDDSASIASVSFVPDTLGGTFYWTGTHKTPTGEQGVHFDSGLMTLIPCP